MGNWAVEFQYNPDKLNDKYGDYHGYYMGVDLRYFKDIKKSEVEYHLRHVMRDGECIDIIKIEDAKKYEERLIKESYCEYRDAGYCTITDKRCYVGTKPGTANFCPLREDDKNESSN